MTVFKPPSSPNLGERLTIPCDDSGHTRGEPARIRSTLMARVVRRCDFAWCRDADQARARTCDLGRGEAVKRDWPQRHSIAKTPGSPSRASVLPPTRDDVSTWRRATIQRTPFYLASLVACDAIHSHWPSVCFIQVSVHAQRRASVPDAVLTTVANIPTMIAVPPDTCTL
jgi:hypothetical protein